MNEETKQLWDSKCKKDYKGKHRWEKLGVVANEFRDVFLVWRCGQCRKCIADRLEFLQSLTSKAKKDG